MKSLREAFGGITEYREDPEYPVEGLLCFICMAMMCGCNAIREIERWGQEHRWELSERLGFRRHRMPKYGTIWRLLNHLDEQTFSDVVATWGRDVLALYGEEEACAIAIDGKVLRGTRDDPLPARELMSALGHELHVVLGQVEIPPETNEMKAIFSLLADLVLEGRVVTLDALLTQREIAKAIRENIFTLSRGKDLLFTPG